MRYGSRKFIAALLVIASADAMLMIGTIDAAVWGATVATVVAAYIAGNVTQKAVTK
ncbi:MULTISPECIES: hypothetical protein [unclassified Cupriavidus]|jgi:hypothetical protein|uniref:hypothetical protein n=1 Tax=unclassified Cupriavidus TaxID=2640874 RepID=UPI001C00211E|nr:MULTISPECIES: hypothetical protein [unclassified Cupriavidus]MCA3194299.1 hypothetical protein [Cupriavidus sp.]MCA3200407.1 hypothetical protein [Cupriavidus sp.]MCA3233820.1 hypothetical protein [Cupriavidus sp.]QWE95356.1 hypothetical protein KLP38_05535 [Cupriavidus sp. EM10]